VETFSDRGPHGVLESASKSLSYWNTADGDDTMVTIWNPADEAQDFVFQLSFAGGHYKFPMHLEARTTRTFNVSEIVDGGIPDPDENIIPSGVPVLQHGMRNGLMIRFGPSLQSSSC